MRTLRLSALAAALTLSGAALTACGSVDENLVETLVKNSDSSVKDVDIDGDTISVETDEGTLSMGQGTKIPDEFPSDVPLPAADYSVLTSSVTNGDIGMMLIAPDLDVAEESERIRAGLEGAGWTIGEKSEMNSGDSSMYVLTATKGSQEVGVTLLRNGDEDGSVMYNVSQE